MKTSKIALTLALVMLLTILAPMAYADETKPAETTEETVEEIQEDDTAPAASSGTCGEDLTWELSGSTLTITGTGSMDPGSPWYRHKDKIKTVILSGSVTSVAEAAFYEYEAITAVDFGGALKEIGPKAFWGCTGLTSIHLPATFRLFGAECFRDCTALETVHCDGGMPSFKSSCLWNGNHISIYIPLNNPWPEDEVDRLIQNFGGRLEVIPATSDSPKPVVVETEPPAATEAPTEAPTEPETEPTTAPTTAPTQPPEPQTIPIVEPTVSPTISETVQEPTEEKVYILPTMAEADDTQEEVSKGLSGGIIAGLLIAGVLTFFLAGALIARSVRNKNRYY